MTAKLKTKDFIYIALISLLMISSLVMGIVFIYFSNIREISNDITRIERINNINSSISNYHYSKSKLPESLKALKDTQYYYYDNTNFEDPKDKGKEFEYYPGQDRKYRICATFEAGTSEINKYKNYRDSGTDYSYLANLERSFISYQVEDKFEFGKGYECIDFEVPQNQYDKPLPLEER